MTNPGPQPPAQAPLLVAQSVNMPALPAAMPRVGSGAPAPLPRAVVGTASAPPGPGLAPVKTDIAGGATGSAPVPVAIGSRRGVDGTNSALSGTSNGVAGTSSGTNTNSELFLGANENTPGDYDY